MAIKKNELYSSLWASCDELRGGMDASLYKDYVLTLLFLKYVSDKFKANTGLIELPQGTTFEDIVRLKNTPEIGDKLNKILAQIAEANDLKGVIDVADFNDEEKLGKGKEQVERLSNLVAIFESLNLSGNEADGDDLLGDAYEYLMRHFATESGKSKGQFYTPAEVSRIMAKIIDIPHNSPSKTTVYDMTCGSGSLLLKAAAQSQNKLSIYGQEKDVATASLARMNMILHNNETAEIRTGNTLSSPAFIKNEQLQTFDFAVANPPFSEKKWITGVTPQDDPYGRFAYGIPPEKNGDYAFLMHMLKSLKPTGKGAIILPHGVLFRGNAEAKIRTEILKQGLIKGIIGLPANLFYGTGIPACIIVIDKEHAQTAQLNDKNEIISGRPIFMMDASKYFIKDGNKNRLREQDIHKIITTFNTQAEIPHYSRLVPLTEIVQHDFNLNLPRYISSGEREDLQDLEAHLYGDIPQEDIDDLHDFWQVFPNLKNELFERQGKRYRAKKSADAIKTYILQNKEYQAFVDQMLAKFHQWHTRNNLRQIKQGSHPKALIQTWSEDLLHTFQDSLLIADYDVYQILMDYWAQTLQDDVYVISQEGWAAGKQLQEITADRRESANLSVVFETEETDKKGKTKTKRTTKKFYAELIAPDLIAKRYFPEQLANVQNCQNSLDVATQNLENYLEENSGEEGLLANAGDDKGKITAKSLKAQQKNSTDSEEKAAIIEVLKLFDAESNAKTALKSAQEALDSAVFTQYSKLTEDEIQTLLVDDKWLATLQTALTSEIERVIQTVVSRLQELEQRYHQTLSALNDEVQEASDKVNAHLKALGLEI
ncbi:type I restriction-modification system subunit M [Gallibacterium anatis]|uniref:site-specific DNA-methyltransferase (adenine-specific) n=1 Tax=Gallibacterium anatis TaxID=750 RepID=A0A1A7NVM5_9PAST|nr:type I restriction-modification system subunit M [Gallibacterium anatis]OBW93748.1 type I restriction-modification protein subunit M [Gallibacterium anatis]OBW98894.1 type I restriction-modification protein subunit M [Gallibacterium anatis]